MTDLPPRPARPYFSSGPCAKPPGWTPDKLALDSLGRSHRSKLGKARLKRCIDLMRANLKLPDTHRIGIVPGSDTGAFAIAYFGKKKIAEETIVFFASDNGGTNAFGGVNAPAGRNASL